MFNFLNAILRDFRLLVKDLNDLCLFLLNFLNYNNLKNNYNNLKKFLVDLDAKLSKKLISLVDRYIARKRANLLNWYILRYLIITREIPKFVPWLFRLVEVRIILMLIDPRNDLTIFWIVWFFGWALWYMICDAFLIHINPIKFALFFVEHFVFAPPMWYLCFFSSQLMLYITARQLFYIRRHKWFFVTNRKRTQLFLKVVDLLFGLFTYYYLTNTIPAFYAIEITYMLKHYF